MNTEDLTNLESRVSYLEMSAPNAMVYHLEERIIELEEIVKSLNIPQWSPKQWDAVIQLKAGYLHLKNNLDAHLDASKKKGKSYKKYI